MRRVETTALALANRDGPARMFEQMLETALVVTYARPYMRNNRAGIDRDWWPEDEDDLAFHKYVIDVLRNPFHAHMDRTARRTLIDTRKYLGLDGPPTYA